MVTQRGSDMRASAWTILRAGIFCAQIASWVLAPVVALLGELEWAGAFVAFALGTHVAGRAWSRVSPVPAQALPYADHVFDTAYLVSVLGEIPDAVAALRDLRRVLKPGGRLLVGELAIDPDFIPLRALRAMASDAGLALERTAAPPFGYCAMLRPE